MVEVEKEKNPQAPYLVYRRWNGGPRLRWVKNTSQEFLGLWSNLAITNALNPTMDKRGMNISQTPGDRGLTLLDRRRRP